MLIAALVEALLASVDPVRVAAHFEHVAGRGDAPVPLAAAGPKRATDA